MFIAENEDVLVAFQALCEQYPHENSVALWEMAGGKFEAAQQSVQPTDETCANCGRPLNGGACAPCFAPSLEDFVSG